MATPLDVVSKLMDVDEGSIPENGICILSLVRPDGKRVFKWGVLGDSLEVGTALGMLTMVSHEFYHVGFEDD